MTEGVTVSVNSSAFYFIYSIVQSLSSPHKLLILSFYGTELQLLAWREKLRGFSLDESIVQNVMVHYYHFLYEKN